MLFLNLLSKITLIWIAMPFKILAGLDKLCCRLNIEETYKINDKHLDILSKLSVSNETSQYPTQGQSIGYSVQAVHQFHFLLQYQE